jgi:hypothetical protein
MGSFTFCVVSDLFSFCVLSEILFAGSATLPSRSIDGSGGSSQIVKSKRNTLDFCMPPDSYRDLGDAVRDTHGHMTV